MIPEKGIAKLSYIHQNLLRAGIVSEPEHYLYSSAGDYAGRKGLIEVEFMRLLFFGMHVLATQIH